MIKKRLIFTITMALVWVVVFGEIGYAERIKDIVSVKGVRENQLVGYGLVVGLDGTGDKKGATIQSLVNMLQRMNITVSEGDMRSKNVAAVVVTTMLPPFPKIGTKINANVSAMGDSKSLQGGTLLMTPLRGADGQVYAVAQGALSVGGLSAGGKGTRLTVNHPTVGVVPEGVTIEKEIGFDLANSRDVSLLMDKSDFTTASNVMKVINKHFGADLAYSPDPSSVVVNVPSKYKGRVVDFVNEIEALSVDVDLPAKIVINERTGTVIIGEKVTLSPVAIAHGDLTIEVKEKSAQPVPFAPAPEGETDITVSSKEVALTKVSGATLGEIIEGLNKLGVSPRDLIAILESLKKAGALKADLEIM